MLSLLQITVVSIENGCKESARELILLHVAPIADDLSRRL
jgi:hypothetical protein